jgi:hypothetical protein
MILWVPKDPYIRTTMVATTFGIKSQICEIRIDPPIMASSSVQYTSTNAYTVVPPSMQGTTYGTSPQIESPVKNYMLTYTDISTICPLASKARWLGLHIGTTKLSSSSWEQSNGHHRNLRMPKSTISNLATRSAIIVVWRATKSLSQHQFGER